MTINVCNPPIGYVEVGRMGENLYRELNIDVSAWLAELPGASVSVVFRRPDGQVYPVIVNSSEQVIAWLPNSSDLAVPGTGMLEVRLYLDDVICKSAVINTATSRALGAPVAPPPAPAPDWVTTAGNDAKRAEAAADRAESAAVHQPMISAAQTWLTWDPDKGLPVRSARPGRRVLPDQTEQLVPQVRPGRRATRVTGALLARSARPGRQVPPERPELQAPQVQLARRATRASRARPARLAQPVRRALREQREQPALRVRQAQRDLLGRKATDSVFSVIS